MCFAFVVMILNFFISSKSFARQINFDQKNLRKNEKTSNFLRIICQIYYLDYQSSPVLGLFWLRHCWNIILTMMVSGLERWTNIGHCQKSIFCRNAPQFLVPADRGNKKNKLKAGSERLNESVGDGRRRGFAHSKRLKINMWNRGPCHRNHGSGRKRPKNSEG